MTDLIDRLREEFDNLGDTVRQGLDRGRLQMERMGVVRRRDDAARELGLLVWQRLQGQDVDDARYDMLVERIGTLMKDIARIDRELAAMKGEEVSVGEDPAPPGDTTDAKVAEE